MAFNCLAVGKNIYVNAALRERRAVLERFVGANGGDALLLSPATDDRDTALAWLARSGWARDGVVAKPFDAAYQAGERAMLKVKQHRTADCVVCGFRRAKDGPLVASLLLGLYDKEGRLVVAPPFLRWQRQPLRRARFGV